MRKITHVVVHCTAASGDQPTQNVLDYWRRKGWKSNGYHWLIDASGLAVRLMDDELIGNGVAGKNKTAIHVCYKGGWNGKDTRTEEQKGMLDVILSDYRKKYPKAVICGHRDLSKDLDGDGVVEMHEWVKLCPCFDAAKEYGIAGTVR